MRNGQILVFDETVTSSATAYTSASLYERLGSHNQIAILVVIDNASATANFDLFIEHSSDSRNWIQRNDITQASTPPGTAGTGDITFNATPNPPQLSANTTFARMFSDPCIGVSKLSGTTNGPLLPFVRFAMKLSAGSAHVKAYVVQRDM